ncbi:MAG: PAS domain-containing protein, partial [Actinobacteria bacterium]
MGGEWWGTLGFAARAQDRDFSGTEIDALRTGARLLGAAIQEERTESALRRSEDRYHKAVDTSPDAILVHQNGVIALANQAAARLLGVPSPNALVGNSVLRF